MNLVGQDFPATDLLVDNKKESQLPRLLLSIMGDFFFETRKADLIVHLVVTIFWFVLLSGQSL